MNSFGGVFIFVRGKATNLARYCVLFVEVRGFLQTINDLIAMAVLEVLSSGSSAPRVSQSD